MKLGVRIKSLRETMEITQDDLAKICNVTKGNISKYENDLIYPPIDTLITISEYFGVTVDYLLGLERTVPDGYVDVILKAKSKNINPEKLKRLIEFLDTLD